MCGADALTSGSPSGAHIGAVCGARTRERGRPVRLRRDAAEVGSGSVAALRSQDRRSRRRSSVRTLRSSTGSASLNRAACATRGPSAASMQVRPASVSRMRNPRRSEGSGSRRTSPASSRRSSRCVIAPQLSVDTRQSSDGDNTYSGPARRSADRTSYCHNCSPNGASASFDLSSRCFARARIRLTSPSGSMFTSGRSRRHCPRMRSTRSDMSSIITSKILMSNIYI